MDRSTSDSNSTTARAEHAGSLTEPQPRHALRRFIVIVLLLVVGVGMAGWLYAIRVTPPRRDIGMPPPYVETFTVELETVTERYLGYGVASAERSTRLSAEVASTVVERVDDIKVGMRVVRGQPLLRFDDREYQAALERALALVAADEAAIDELTVLAARLEPTIATAEEELRVAAAEFERVSGLFERDLAAEKEMNVGKLAYQQARRLLLDYQREAALIAPRRKRLMASQQSNQASAEMARLNAGRCLVSAPFDGVIEELTVDVGDRVAPGTHLVTVLDPSRVEIPVRLAGSVYDRVRIGTPCDLVRETTPGVNWTGEVARIGPTIDSQTRTFAAFLIVDNRQQQRPLVPGTFLRASVHGPTHVDVLVVPRSAIRDDRVFVVHEGLARARRIRVRHFVEERAVVDGALQPGDRVILTSLDIITDGAPVRVAESISAEHRAHADGPVPTDNQSAAQGSNTDEAGAAPSATSTIGASHFDAKP